MRVDVPSPGEFELHLNNDPALPKKYGRKVRGIGGSYTSARGYEDTRIVRLPNTSEGRAMANVLAKAFFRPSTGSSKTGTIIMREVPGLTSYATPSWVTVRYFLREVDDPVAVCLASYENAFRQAAERGLI
jgi:hypothetical protein